MKARKSGNQLVYESGGPPREQGDYEMYRKAAKTSTNDLENIDGQP